MCSMTNEPPIMLKQVGLKVTPARKFILDLFSSDCEPINAEFIFGKLKSKDINQVTIYRTLASLELTRIIKRVDLRKGSTYYELAGNHHHHLVCLKCGRTEGFEHCDIDTISKTVLKKSSQFKSIDQHSLELFGMCKSCSKG